MTFSFSSIFQSARKQAGSKRRRAAVPSHRRSTGRLLEAEIRYQTSEVLETRTLLAAQLVSSDITNRTISAGETFEVEVRYQTLDDDGNAAALKSNLIGFNLLFDTDQIEWLDTPTSGIFIEGAQVLPTEVRLESEDAIKDDDDPDTDSALVAAYSDNDPLFNAGWPNNIDTNGIVVYTARFRAKDSFTGTTIRFTDNATGNVTGQNAAFEFQSQSLELTPPVADPVVSISDASAVEGDDVSFTVTLDAASDQVVSVVYSTEDTNGPDGALAGTDYTAQIGQTLTFQPGQTSQTIQIATTDDSINEVSEVFLLKLTGATGATLGDDQATGTITDNDDSLPTVSISNATSVEEGGTSTFTVTLSAASDSPLSVNFSTLDSTGPDAATAGSDYTAQANGSVTFSPGQTTQTIQIETIDDDVVEEDEVFFVQLTSAPGATLATSQATGTITDNDVSLPTLSISDAATVEEGETAVFTVTLSAASDSAVTVNFATDSSGPTAATAGQDFTAVTNGSLTFAAGEVSQTIGISTTDDSDVEQTETFSVVLSGAVGALLADATGDVSLLDNDVNGDNGTARIRKFNDLNGDGQRSNDEPWLNGWTIQLLGTNGQVVAEGVTADVDLNEDGEIDPATERGWALLGAAAGTYTVQEVSQDGWVQTTPTTAAAAAAYGLDQEYDFETTGSDFQNWGGLGERWILSNDGWFFVTPAGELYQWDDSPRDDLSGTKVATLTSEYHSDLTRLVDVQQADAPELTVVPGQETDVLLFGNQDVTVTGSISGRKWNDLDGNGQRSDDEPWLNGWTVELLDSLGTVVASTVTTAVDLNDDGMVDPVTEAGVYSFGQLGAGHYSVREVMVDGWTQTSPFSEQDEEAFKLDAEYGFDSAGSTFGNWGGLGERWVRGNDAWFYITPNGSLYEWNNSPRTNLSGSIVSELGVRYYNDLTLLTHAIDPSAAYIDLAVGEDRMGVDFGNQQEDTGGNSGFDGEGNVSVRVSGSSLILSGDGSDNGVHVYLNDNGYVTVAGMGDTTINGESTMVLDGWTSIGTDLRATLAGGSDAFVLSGVTVGRNLTVNSSNGEDSVIIRDSVISGNVSATDLHGSNIFVALDTQISGATSVSMGSGSDLVHLNGVTSANVTVLSRGGSDGVVAQDSSLNGLVRVYLGAGNDQLATIGDTHFGGRVVVAGQAGTDVSTTSSGTTFSSEPVVRGIESDDGDAVGLLDRIMQRLADAGLDDLV